MSGSQTPHLVKEEAQLQNTQQVWKEQKYGHVTKIDHAGEGQQQFTQLDQCRIPEPLL
jgi:hypothetical protein